MLGDGLKPKLQKYAALHYTNSANTKRSFVFSSIRRIYLSKLRKW